MVNDCFAELQLTMKPKRARHPRLDTSKDLYETFMKVFDMNTFFHHETSLVIYLDSGLRMVGWMKLSDGGISSTLVDVRVALQGALLCNACMMALAHNHPSGSVRPSREDDLLTSRVQKGAQAVNIPMIDHVICADNEYFSYNDEGRL